MLVDAARNARDASDGSDSSDDDSDNSDDSDDSKEQGDNEKDSDDDSDDDGGDEDEEEDNNDDEEDGDDDNNNMPPKLKPPPAAVKSSKKSPLKKERDVEKLAESVKKVKISKPVHKPYSMKTTDGFMVKAYCQQLINFVEIDVHVAGVLKPQGFKIELSSDGLSLIWSRAIPAYFFESKRMVSMLKNSYHPNDSRVIAHDNVVQQIRTGGTESKGLHFAAAEDAMIVQLGVVCTGNVRVTEDLKKIGEVVYSGHTHFQFNTIYTYTCRVKTMKEQTTQKRRVRRVVHDSDEDLSEEENSDEDDDDEEMTPVGVRSVPP